jgi:hypothetical protein
MFGQDANQNQWPAQGAPTEPAGGPPEPSTDSGFAASVPDPAPAAFSGSDIPPSVPTSDVSPITAPEPSLSIPDPIDDTPALPANGTVSNDDLLQIKQNALQELSPLVGHLDQSAEEKFRTTMMMIQASDDHTLLQSAYDTAKQITDEKVRAQALLDVINEINYFTQQHHQA